MAKKKYTVADIEALRSAIRDRNEPTYNYIKTPDGYELTSYSVPPEAQIEAQVQTAVLAGLFASDFENSGG